MQPNNLQQENASLQLQQKALEELFEASMRKDHEFAKVKAIFHDLKMVKDRLAEIEKQNGQNESPS